MDDSFDRMVKAQEARASQGLTGGNPGIEQLGSEASAIIKILVDCDVNIGKLKEQREAAQKRLVAIRIQIDETLSDWAPFAKRLNGALNQGSISQFEDRLNGLG